MAARSQKQVIQVAGDTCVICGNKIVFAQDGKCCPNCGIVVHCACDSENNCDRCGGAYQNYEHPTGDPAREAFVPRSLRPGGNSVTVAVAIMGALLFLFAFLVLWVFYLRG